MVAVDWDSCHAHGACIEACIVQVFQWFRTADDLAAIEMVNAISGDNGENYEREGRKDYSDKSDPIREQDCIWYMTSISVCPSQAIKVISLTLNIMKENQENTMNQLLNVVLLLPIVIE
jgi:NAD-dependent dihydropyrimidine dehydrogenase PreA subunit